MKTCVLLLLIKEDQVLLAMKKRGFGSGRWNGVGGKVNANETIEQALVRECEEEINVTPLSYVKVAIHDFIFPSDMPDMLVHTFVCKKWTGKPIETEEMAPQWFKINDIPYDAMWQDDIVWLPHVLRGKKLKTRFTFDAQERMTTAEFTIVEEIQ